MILKVILLIILGLGAFVSYFASFIVKKASFLENTENNIVKVKLFGFIIVLATVICIFIKF